MKLVISNGWSDLNSGDSAIIMGIIKRFSLEHQKLEVKILSELCVQNLFYTNSIEKIKTEFPDVLIETIPSPFYKVYNRGFLSKVHELLSLIYVYIMFTFGLKKDAYFNAIKESDVLISKGGHFIFDRGGIWGIFHLLKCLYPLKVAQRIDKPFSILAQSMGPFYSDNYLGNMKLKYTLNVLNSARGISFREEISLKKMVELGLNTDKVNLTSDYAFLLDRKEINKNSVQNPYIIVTLRQHNYIKENGEIGYLQAIKSCCDNLHQKYGVNVLVIPHVKGPNSFEDDRLITDEFKKLVKETKYYHFNDAYYSAPELIELYSHAELLIGTRFHSVIFALISNVPAFAISYSGYKANIIRQFKLDKYMLDINDLATGSNNKFNVLVEELYTNRSELSKLIGNQMKHVKDTIINDKAFLNLGSN